MVFRVDKERFNVNLDCKKKRIRCHAKKFPRFSHPHHTTEALKAYIFKLREKKQDLLLHIHLSQFAKQIIFSPSRESMFTLKAYDENIKKIARKIQIHNANDILDKTFLQKMCTIFIIYNTLELFFRNPYAS